jgi:hypothetical protein
VLGHHHEVVAGRLHANVFLGAAHAIERIDRGAGYIRVVTQPSGPGDDAAWRKPENGATRSTSEPTGMQAGPGYLGPPPTNAPPAGWRPPVVIQPAAPRALPEQNHDRLDVAERAARTLTNGIGMVVGAILLVLLLILCARGIF